MLQIRRLHVVNKAHWYSTLLRGELVGIWNSVADARNKTAKAIER